MRALLIDGYAPVPAASLGDPGLGRPSPGEVRVRIEAAALNPLDAKLARGDMTGWFPLAFPYIPGTDFAGEVLAVGEGVTAFCRGDAVFGRADPTSGGAMAEELVVPVGFVAPRPPSVDAVTAACLPTPAGIAHQALFEHLRVAEPARLLVLGAGGAVGRAAVQLVSPGIEVVACAGRSTPTVSASNVRWIGPDGPDLERWAAEVDVVLDCSGGECRRRALAAMRPGTKLASIVQPAETAAGTRGVRTSFLVLETRRETLNAVALAAARDVVRPEPPATFGIEEAVTTYRDYVAGRRSGKLVMTIGDARRAGSSVAAQRP